MENMNNYANQGPAKRRPDPVLLDLLKDEVYSVQSVPGDGSCFFYTVVMILLGYTREYTTERPNKYVRSSMDRLRSITAHTIYQDPEVLQIQMMDDEGNPNTIGNMKKRDGNPTGPPDPQTYFDYFLKGENLPYANDPEVGVVQRLPMFNQTLMVIYNDRGSEKQYEFVCHMHIPDVVHDIVLIRRSNDSHYEPIVFYVDGRWEHRLSLDRRFDPDFKPLFRALFDQCPAVREKITF